MHIGLASRAEQAGAAADNEQRRALLAAVDRLTSPAQMGEVSQGCVTGLMARNTT